jgi:S-adenosylmethionine/arginine decarboxylase-like enzyme
MDIDKALDYIQVVFKPEEMIVKYLERGVMDPAKRRFLKVKDYEPNEAFIIGGKK